MEKSLLYLEREISKGEKNAQKAYELYQLLSSYNAYNILLLNAKKELERKNANIKKYYSDSNCYKKQIDPLFSLFKSNECLRGTLISDKTKKDIFFLIDSDTLLRMSSSDIVYSNIGGLSSIDYNLVKINNCIAKVFAQRVYCGDPYYCDYHWEKKDAFGFFFNNNLITPSYELENKLKSYDNKDIRDILKIQSLDEIHEKISEAKNQKEKKLILLK